jgi:hypothetical protein
MPTRETVKFPSACPIEASTMPEIFPSTFITPKTALATLTWDAGTRSGM